MNGGTFTAKPKPGGSLFASLRQGEFWALWAPQFAVFLFLLFFYAFGFMKLPSICVILSGIFFMIAGVLFAFRKEGRTFLPTSMLLPVAVAAGSVGGLYVYDVYAIYPQFYSNARVYTDVLASQSAEAVADAGKLIFTDAAYVDRPHSVSYITERGSVFCVAPVRDSGNAVEIQYWAVGTGCCSASGDFWCDDSKDSKAKGGIVIFDNEGFFSGSSYDEFSKASRKAEATYQLLSVHHPRYLRWVNDDDLNRVANEYNLKAGLSLTACTMAYAVLSGGPLRFDGHDLPTSLAGKMTSSAPEHASWFELRRDGRSLKSSDLVEEAVYHFEYLGPEVAEAQSQMTMAGAEPEDPEPLPAASTAPASASTARWRITGGADKGGIIVRQSESLKSPELGRVSTGAIVEEVARVGERLCYRLEEGSGPAKGWVSIRVSGKELVEKIAS
ncbi:unnamed protein product [Durusdinium trenchii]|uniref:SH3b domain-containing protein n=1 Tax=Durusdinium trenchii TaxID=1381693 RepID=A0ABP0MD74_9DINO